MQRQESGSATRHSLGQALLQGTHSFHSLCGVRKSGKRSEGSPWEGVHSIIMDSVDALCPQGAKDISSVWSMRPVLLWASHFIDCQILNVPLAAQG